jgi:hypothetical protein
MSNAEAGVLPYWATVHCQARRERVAQHFLKQFGFDLPARLARTLLRYPAQGNGPPKPFLSQRELAEIVGATRESVTQSSSNQLNGIAA